MPLEYEGTLAEHRACRELTAIFDVSHLGTVRITDPDEVARVGSVLTNDLSKIHPGRAQYTHLLDDDGSVLDDIIVWWLPDGTLDVMPNASNTSRVIEALGGRDVTAERAVIAVQGPTARAILQRLMPDAAAVGRFDVAFMTIDGIAVTVAGTGYTGEDGIEIAVPSANAPTIWSQFIDAGATPAGLGARDTLRLEAGLPLHGHELGPGITPLQAGLGWVLATDGRYRGASAIERERAAGLQRRLRGISTEGRRPPREGNAVFADGVMVATVTSGNYSPTLGHGIAMAFLPPECAIGDAIEVDVRGTRLPGVVVALPFLRR